MTTDFQPEIIVLFCGRASAGSPPEGQASAPGYQVRYVKMPCSSKIEPLDVVKLFNTGIDGVLVVACPTRNCQFLFGDVRAGSRAKYVSRLIEEIGLGAGRISIVSESPNDLSTLAAKFADSVRPLGPNPLKKGQLLKV